MNWSDQIWGKAIVVTIAACFWFLMFCVPAVYSYWEKRSAGIRETEVRTVFVHPGDRARVFAGTGRGLYRSKNAGKSYYPVFQVPGSETAVNYIYISPALPNTIYAATDSGLFRSQNNGESWERIYQSADPLKRKCLCVLADTAGIFLGTKKGLYWRETNDETWQEIKNPGGSEAAVRFLAQDDEHLYAGGDSDLFRLNKSTRAVEKIFSLGFRQGDNTAGEEDVFEAEVPASLIRSIYVFPLNPPAAASSYNIYLATVRGIFVSADQGNSWQQLNSNGLPLEELTSIVIFSYSAESQRTAEGQIPESLSIFAGTQKGAYLYLGRRWVPVYQGMETNRIFHLATDSENGVYAGTDKGVFFIDGRQVLPQHLSSGAPAATDAKGGNLDYKTMQSYFMTEPSINEVHRMAIAYAEVDPQKIQDWRSKAKLKALLPSVSFGLDRAATDLYHWDTGMSPDVLTKGKEYVDWDVSLSWDLADLVWSTDQTSIDSRSKLMVELREDILDQITRLYFERRRIQMELLASDLEAWIAVEKEMRVAELTALIDGFTGGRFSRQIETNKKEESHVRRP